jgi:hypothetical protein
MATFEAVRLLKEVGTMNTPPVKTFHALRTLKLRVKHVEDVQITKAGGHFKARFRGHCNFVFGSTAEEAKHRLLTGVAKKWKIVPTRISNLEKQLLEACR